MTTLDDAGRITSFVDPNGNAIIASYTDDDSLGQLLYADGSIEHFEYDDDGFFTRHVTRSGNDVMYAYNERELLVRCLTQSLVGVDELLKIVVPETQ